MPELAPHDIEMTVRILLGFALGALLGWERASTLSEAISMARGTMGRSAQITMLYHPPILMMDVL